LDEPMNVCGQYVGVFLIFVANCFNYAAAGEASARNFEVTVWKVNDKREKKELYIALEQKDVYEIGSGVSKDLFCAGRTDESGLLQCRIKTCDENETVPIYYRIEFNVPFQFSEVQTASVKVVKCSANPSGPKPYFEAHFMEKSFVTKMTEEDSNHILGFSPEVAVSLGAGVPQGQDIGGKLSSLSSELYGPVRISNFRRLMQDLSAKAVMKGYNKTASIYQGYAIASANVTVGNIASHYFQFDPNVVYPVTGKMRDLNYNLDELVKNLDRTDWKKDPYHFVFKPKTTTGVLADVKTDVSSGILNSAQFKELEDLNRNLLLLGNVEKRI
jgi:hypothetical protein